LASRREALAAAFRGAGVAALAALAPALLHAQRGAVSTASGRGEVRRVDRDRAQLTIRHAGLPALDMPPMTLVFRVRDASLLVGLKEGDRIRFQAEKQGRQYVVTALAREQG
jgi:Cu/Ag efflux protein CusF